MPVNQNKVVPYMMVVPVPMPRPSPLPPPAVNSFIDNHDHRRRHDGGGASVPPCTCLSSVLGGLLLFTLLVVAVVIPLIVFLNPSRSVQPATTTTITSSALVLTMSRLCEECVPSCPWSREIFSVRNAVETKEDKSTESHLIVCCKMVIVTCVTCSL